MDVLASQLRQRASDLGLSNSEAARRAGLSERRYAHYVTGIREPDLMTLVRIAEALKTTPDHLLGLGQPEEASPRKSLLDRLNSAAHVLSDDRLEIVVIQTEALSGLVNSARRRKGTSVRAVPT